MARHVVRLLKGAPRHSPYCVEPQRRCGTRDTLIPPIPQRQVQPKRCFLAISNLSKYRGSCIVDTETYLSRKDKTTDEGGPSGPWKFLADELTFESEDSDMSNQIPSVFVFLDFHHLIIADMESLPSERHYFLLDPMIPGFTLQDKSWKVLNVEGLTEFQKTTVMENLIIDPIHRDIVRAITYAQTQSFKVDHVSSKGEG